MDKFRDFQESLAAHFNMLHKAMNRKTNRELDDALILQGTSVEQRQVIKDVCCAVDKEHDMIEEMFNSDKAPGSFLEQDIIDTVKTIRPNASSKEVEQVVEATMDAMEKEIERDANDLLKDTLLMFETIQDKS